jgi:hypothetical protein
MKNIYSISGHAAPTGDGYDHSGTTDVKFTNKAKAIKKAKEWLNDLKHEEGRRHEVTVWIEDEDGNGKGIWHGEVDGSQPWKR